MQKKKMRHGSQRPQREDSSAAAAHCLPSREVLKMKRVRAQLDLQLRSGGAGPIDFDPASIMPAVNEDVIKMRGKRCGKQVPNYVHTPLLGACAPRLDFP